MHTERRWRRGIAFFASLLLLVLLVAVTLRVFAYVGTTSTSGANKDLTVSRTEAGGSQAPTPTGCTTWATAPSDYTNNRWFANGIAAIRDAKTNEEATEAAHVWLAEVRKDPNLLAGAAKYFLQRDVDKATLSTDGCATDKAVQLVTEIELTIGNAKSIVPDSAPATGYNSGVENGIVVGSSAAGINGDLKAIKITLSDGRVIWILARCGNIVTITPPVVPPGKTDQPPVVTPPVVTPPPTLEQKVPSRDPAAQGNAPVGGGKNIDPGPGTYVPPSQMSQPPAAPYTAPAAPKVTTPPVGSVPDPVTAPPRQTAAPAPTAPATGCIPAPGMPATTC